MNPLYRHSFGVHIKNPIFCQNSPPIFQKLAQIILLHFPLKKNTPTIASHCIYN